MKNGAANGAPRSPPRAGSPRSRNAFGHFSSLRDHSDSRPKEDERENENSLTKNFNGAANGARTHDLQIHNLAL